ncbi:MAG TPA: SDR family NAD(P)-dependent oxidoreductase [Syntrophobacteria bacterium]|nr:SDR family NAD(P)-dependent oxidoreductase [Syntrophobacteria bacterium]
MTRVVAVTGATGFIGGALAQRLATAGWRIRVLVRPTSTRGRLAGVAADLVVGDLGDLDSLRRFVYQADAVVHCAGAVRGASQAHFDRVNVEGVARLVHAAASEHPAPRFLLISSLAAREPGLSAYAASKRRGEEVLVADGGMMPWAVLRPPAVYGPGDRELLPLFRWMARGIAPVLGSGNARFSLLYVEDLAEAVVRWLSGGTAVQRTFELDDCRPGGYTWTDVVDIMKTLRSRSVIPVRVPALLLQVLAFVNLVAARVIGYKPMVTPGKVRELRHPNWVCDSAAFMGATGWSPKVSLEEGLRRTLLVGHGS